MPVADPFFSEISADNRIPTATPDAPYIDGRLPPDASAARPFMESGRFDFADWPTSCEIRSFTSRALPLRDWDGLQLTFYQFCFVVKFAQIQSLRGFKAIGRPRKPLNQNSYQRASRHLWGLKEMQPDSSFPGTCA
jgi:hypothetical protein